jgi:hypothetical protein
MTAAAEQAASALAARLHRAVAEDWDTDRCTVEARSYVAEMRNRGWVWEPAASGWNHRPRKPIADPDVIASSIQEMRQAVREAQTGQTKDANEEEDAQ